LSQDEATHNIQNTPGTAKLAPGANKDLMTEQIPLGRMGDAFDIAMTAIFLCSSAGSFISGDVLVVDGAHWLFKPPIVPHEVVSELSRKMESNTSRSSQQQKSVLSKL
jgi:peroxisomal 2,4-dienoyl-CoA reductase